MRAKPASASGAAARELDQGGKRLGDKTSGLRFVQCVMRNRTGTSALFALPVRILDAKSCFRTNRKSVFLLSLRVASFT